MIIFTDSMAVETLLFVFQTTFLIISDSDWCERENIFYIKFGNHQYFPGGLYDYLLSGQHVQHVVLHVRPIHINYDQL